MSTTRGVGGSPSTPSAPTTPETPATTTTTTTTSSSTQATPGAPAQTPGQPQTPQGSTATPQQANQQRAEAGLQGTARQAQLQGPARQITQQSVLDGARRSGLNNTEVTQLQTRLQGMNPAERRGELRFLQSHVLNSANPDRGMRTYLELQTMHDAHPSRITSDVVHTLTRGVAERRTESSRGREGILGQDSAVNAARALTGMTQSDYGHTMQMLNQAGQDIHGRTVRGSDPQAERSLILESIAARREQLTHPTFTDRFRNMVGLPSSALTQVQSYSDQIRGMRRNTLIDQSTVQDLRDDNRAGGLQQRFEDSCAPTSMQIARAEADPIYARQLHQEAIHATAMNTGIAGEQRTNLTNYGGVAVARGQTTGTGLQDPAIQNMLNQQISGTTNHTYALQSYPNSPPATGLAGRRAALDRIDSQLRRGVDVPIGVSWNGGGGHCMLMTDVRGAGANRQFLISDPYSGRTSWVRGADIASGNTNFFGSRGVMDASWE